MAGTYSGEWERSASICTTRPAPAASARPNPSTYAVPRPCLLPRCTTSTLPAKPLSRLDASSAVPSGEPSSTMIRRTPGMPSEDSRANSSGRFSASL